MYILFIYCCVSDMVSSNITTTPYKLRDFLFSLSVKLKGLYINSRCLANEYKKNQEFG